MGIEGRRDEWWQRLEGAQAAPIGHDAQHWVGVYDELIRALRRMETDLGDDPAMLGRVRGRLAQAQERRRHWAAFDDKSAAQDPSG